MSRNSGLATGLCGESEGRTTGPFLRYTRGHIDRVCESGATQDRFADTEGWLLKPGRKTGQRVARYFRLCGDRLSNHRQEQGPPTWTHTMLGASVTVNARTNEISVRLSSGRELVVAATNRREYQRWRYSLRRASVCNGVVKLGAFYQTGDVIGDGASGEVLAGVDRMTSEPVAIKSLPLNNEDRAVTEEEISIATCLNHPHLVRTYDVFRDVKNATAHVVMEFAAGGELRKRVDTPDGSSIGEKDGVRIARNLLSAMEYLHQRGIVHRDIKLENVLCVDDDPDNAVCVKLADFGSSSKLGSNRTSLNTQVGTSFYLAPEIIQKQPYGRPVDMWALGALLYITLSGELPFPGTMDDDYCTNAVNLALEFPGELWSSFSTDARDFIEKLMDKNPDCRLTASQALNHPWITNPAIESVQLDTQRHLDDNTDDPVLQFDTHDAHNSSDGLLPPVSLPAFISRRNERGLRSPIAFARRRTPQESSGRKARHQS